MFAKVIGLIMQSNINLTTLYFMNTLQSLLDTFVIMLKKNNNISTTQDTE